MADEIVRYSLEDDIAVLRWDDGGANVVSTAFVAEMNAHLDRAADEAKAMVLFGRPGRFCAGFDLAVMSQGGDAVKEMVGAGARLAMRLYGDPIPVVAAVTGHAVAMGAVLLMAVDSRIGARGKFKIGLNEVAIGMTLPEFATELAKERLAPTHRQRAAALAEIFGPDDAVAAGFLDRLAEPAELEAAAMDEARRLASLDLRAYKGTIRIMRGDVIARLEKSLRVFG